MKKQIMLTGLCAMLMAAASVRAEDDDWKFTLTPYLWAMGLDGDIGVGAVSVPVDVKFSDAVQDLDLAGMMVAEAHNGTWGVLVDAAYMKLSDDTTTAVGQLDVDIEQWIVQGAAIYRVVSDGKTTLDVGPGARSMQTDVDGELVGHDFGSTERWLDPIAFARVRQQFAENCFGVLAADIGGFGVTSDLTWQVTAAAGYALTDSIALLAGYRYLDYDYDKDGFSYNVATSGVMAGLQFAL